MRPVVGICTAVERARWTTWDEPATLLSRKYADAVQSAGGLCVLLPPDPAPEAAALLDRIDALVLAGGADIDPGTYGAGAGEFTSGTDPRRDRFEIGLTCAALERGLPLLGVCRGMHLLNVALGGTLVQHLPDALDGSEIHKPAPGEFGRHEVLLEPGSLAANAVGAERIEVHSHHHQGIDRIGEGLIVTGRSGPDGVCEAIERPGSDFALGVLWHPEEQPGALFESLVAVAARAGARA